MLYEIKVDDKVTSDFAQAFEYYDNISEKLSKNFHSSFLLALDKLSHKPENYFNVSKRFRRITLQKFPYMLVYEVKDTQVIVRALFHQSANFSKVKKL